MKNKERGITLIALVVTIVVLLILATIGISTLTGNYGTIKQTKFAKFGAQIREYQKAIDSYVLEQDMNKDGREETIIFTENKEEIKKIIPIISDEDLEKYVIQNNELRYRPDEFSEEEKGWLAELGVAAMGIFYLITFMNGDKVFKTVYADKITFPRMNPTSSQGIFAGWFYDQEGTNQATEEDSFSSDITLYANYESLTEYILNFHDNTWGIFDTVKSRKVKFPENNASDTGYWTCGCSTYNVRLVFSKYWGYPEGTRYPSTGGIELKEGDKLTNNLEVLTEYKAYSEDIEDIQNLSFYCTGNYKRPSTLQKTTIKVYNGEFQGEEITNVTLLDTHNARRLGTGLGQPMYYIGHQIYQSGTTNLGLEFLIDDNGNVIQKTSPTEENSFGYNAIHIIVEITTSSGKKSKVLYNITPYPNIYYDSDYYNYAYDESEIQNWNDDDDDGILAFIFGYGYGSGGITKIVLVPHENAVSYRLVSSSGLVAEYNPSVDENGNLVIDGMPNTNVEGVFSIEVTYQDGNKTTYDYEFCGNIYCLAKGTKITLADHTTKNIEDIQYEDNLLVWDFDNGKFATAKPLWIKKVQTAEEYNYVKFEDGTELKTVADHRIFNMESQKFTYTMNEQDTPIGTTVFKEDGTVTKLIERKVVKEEVEYYNIITNYHMNLFANGLLTSLRLNNLYKIKDMKFVKDDRKLATKEEFKNIPEEYFYGLRLAEQPKEINSGNDVKHTKTLEEYVQRLLPMAKEKNNKKSNS